MPDAEHVELKAMHTSVAARRQGVGRAMVGHLLTVAADRGFRRVSLETGTMDAFAPARALCSQAGFIPCPPFGDYSANPHSTCMTITPDAPLRARLHDNLAAAMKTGDRAAVSALRSALSAIDNAEAVAPPGEQVVGDGPIAGARAGPGVTDVPRRELSSSDIADIIRAEIADRQAAADLYAERAEPERAERLRAEAAVLSRVHGGGRGS
jgi:uncharacterized protein YqeY